MGTSSRYRCTILLFLASRMAFELSFMMSSFMPSHRRGLNGASPTEGLPLDAPARRGKPSFSRLPGSREEGQSLRSRQSRFPTNSVLVVDHFRATHQVPRDLVK